ncbi:MAG: PQQ-binding-like beta-propeller repeat protein [Deltaproteobacteria bacterium]|nr:PQQ-binding-like beta-propeller repeat protein [Deltaproteobacteria bacterium]
MKKNRIQYAHSGYPGHQIVGAHPFARPEYEGPHGAVPLRSTIAMVVLFSFFLLNACASDACTDGQCKNDPDVEWGTSRLVALEPETGEWRWHVDFNRAEAMDIRRLQDNGKSVVVAAIDPCFMPPPVAAFDLETGNIVDVLPVTGESTEVDWCAGLTLPGVSVMTHISGICVGRDNGTGDVVALDPAKEGELWREPLNADSIHVFGSALMVISHRTVNDAVQYLAQRISAVNGSVMWQHPGDYQITPLGADNKNVFLLDIRPFALNVTSGDLIWEHFERGWDFLPGRDGGALMGDTLLVKRQYFLESDCVDTDTRK